MRYILYNLIIDLEVKSSMHMDMHGALINNFICVLYDSQYTAHYSVNSLCMHVYATCNCIEPTSICNSADNPTVVSYS